MQQSLFFFLSNSLENAFIERPKALNGLLRLYYTSSSFFSGGAMLIILTRGKNVKRNMLEIPYRLEIRVFHDIRVFHCI